MSKEISFKEIMESNHYAQQKEVVFNSINKTQVIEKTKTATYAPPSSLPSINRTMSVDYSTFKKLPGEAGEIATMKANLPKTRGYKFKTLTKVAM